ncbi:MAG: hypothetical protein J2P17_14540 [Mycobacterium sp.]|nr:hypothetical protein [Mycobacterium sp.]
MSRFNYKAVAAVAVAGAAAAALAAPTLASATNATSSNLYAKINASGALVAGNGVTSSTALGPGQYEVTFNRNVSSCAYVATPENAFSQAVQVFTASGHLSTSGVYVETKNQGGGLTSAPFDLVVDCGSTNTPYAVVGYNANLVRSSGGVTLSHPGPGRYNITFPRTVNTCAALATVADPGNGLVFNPFGVYTGEGPNTNTIYIETKNGGGGLQDGAPFHLVLMCSGAPNVSGAKIGANGITGTSFNSMLSYQGSTGQYLLVTRNDITNCATIATRGSINRAVPFSPSTTESVAGPAANTVGVQVRNLLFFGGGFDSQSFHTAVVC